MPKSYQTKIINREFLSGSTRRFKIPRPFYPDAERAGYSNDNKKSTDAVFLDLIASYNLKKCYKATNTHTDPLTYDENVLIQICMTKQSYSQQEVKCDKNKKIYIAIKYVMNS